MSTIYEIPCVKGFIRMCNDGWLQGWHERNGGNLTYRMTAEEVAACRPYFDAEPREWVNMGVQADNLAGEYFITTGSGKFFRNVEPDPIHSIGIVEINDKGDSWRIVWGLAEGARPTSEFPSHFMNHSVRKAATNGANRVIYHCHATNVIALTYILPLTDRDFTRALWQSATECPVVFPEGVGVCPWMVPGGAEIAMLPSGRSTVCLPPARTLTSPSVWRTPSKRAPRSMSRCCRWAAASSARPSPTMTCAPSPATSASP